MNGDDKTFLDTAVGAVKTATKAGFSFLKNLFTNPTPVQAAVETGKEVVRERIQQEAERTAGQGVRAGAAADKGTLGTLDSILGRMILLALIGTGIWVAVKLS